VGSSDAGRPETWKERVLSEAITSSPSLKGRSSAETRSAIVDVIRSEGEISRTELARRSLLTEATISKIVKSLLEDGIIVESGFAKSTGGKRPVLLRLNDQMLYAVGITLDVTRCVIVLCGLDGAEVDRCEIEGIGQDEPPLVLDRVARALQQLLNGRGTRQESIVGVGVASGGRGFSPGRKLDATFVDSWEPYPVEEELSARTGFAVIRENDANCAALGEYWTTGGSPTRDFITLYMAYGIGCGLIIAGGIYRGISGNAGEIGHTLAVSNGSLCWCGRRGCLDTVASPRAVTEQIVANPTLRAICDVTRETEFGVIYRRFGLLVKDGNEPARRLFQATADHLSNTVNDLVNTLDLDLVLLAGPGFADLGEEYRCAIEEQLATFALTRGVRPITVRLGTGGADAAARGAASVVLHRELTPHRSVASP
jgi:predicted NBD/HSP70 family sugar kinase